MKFISVIDNGNTEQTHLSGNISIENL